MKVARSKDEPGKGGFWRLDLERLEESRRSKRRSSLTVRAPRNRPHSAPQRRENQQQRRAKRHRPPNQSGERKHNILSNISICGETDETQEEEETREVPQSMPNESVVAEPVNQMMGEDELTGLLLASGGWDECQLELLDSLLDSL